MRVLQLLPTIAYGDAVGNDAVAIGNLLRELNYDTAIYAENYDSRVEFDKVYSYIQLPKLSKNDVIIYHFSTGSEIMEKILMDCPAKKIMIYHNITPAKFFQAYDSQVTKYVESGRNSLQKLNKKFDFCIADSEYNKRELEEYGYICPIYVLPVLIPFKDYNKKPNIQIINEYGNDDWTNIIFVGRVAPNKKQEDVIKTFAFYKRHINSKSRLFIIGDYKGFRTYFNRLEKYVNTLNVKDVKFTGHISFDSILAYYKIADIFVCMSEHEGFCVPLVESMLFSTPVIAYNSSAVPETLGNSGVILKEKNSAVAAYLIKRILSDKVLYNEIIAEQKKRLQDFSYDLLSVKYKELLDKIISGESILTDKGASGKKSVFEQIVLDIDVQVNEEGIFDQSIPFNSIPSDSISVECPKDNLRFHWKHWIKMGLLKPAFIMIHACFPNFAEKVRSYIYAWKVKKISSNLLADKIIVNDSIQYNKPMIYVDVTQITKDDSGTGIQRVVNNVFWGLNQLTDNVVPVRIFQDKLITCNRYLARVRNENFKGIENYIQFHEGDSLFLLDSSWEYYKTFSDLIQQAHEQNVNVIGVVHDLFPIQYPELFTSEHFKNVFTRWHNMLVTQCDSIICNSQTTADVVYNYCQNKNVLRKSQMELYYFHLGANIKENEGHVREQLKNILARDNVFLMVGTVEPRKGHMVVLEALKKSLSVNAEIYLLILGHNGWENNEIKALIQNPLISSHVIWIQNAEDSEVQYAYKNATALIAASKDEGFGLPLVEASYFHLLVICSDIPIFREVMKEHATYFTVMDSNSLKDAILNCLDNKDTIQKLSNSMTLYNWEDSAGEVLDILQEKTIPYREL